jgi:hypothetical protein
MKGKEMEGGNKWDGGIKRYKKKGIEGMKGR